MPRPPYRILVIEDHPDVGDMMKTMVGMLGHGAEVARSLAEAVATLTKESFDLLLVDYRLPDGSGADLLRKLSSTETPPAVLLTAYDEDTLEPSAKAGFAACLRKPVDLGVLKETIEKLCSGGP